MLTTMVLFCCLRSLLCYAHFKAISSLLVVVLRLRSKVHSTWFLSAILTIDICFGRYLYFILYLPCLRLNKLFWAGGEIFGPNNDGHKYATHALINSNSSRFRWATGCSPSFRYVWSYLNVVALRKMDYILGQQFSIRARIFALSTRPIGSFKNAPVGVMSESWIL